MGVKWLAEGGLGGLGSWFDCVWLLWGVYGGDTGQLSGRDGGAPKGDDPKGSSSTPPAPSSWGDVGPDPKMTRSKDSFWGRLRAWGAGGTGERNPQSPLWGLLAGVLAVLV